MDFMPNGLTSMKTTANWKTHDGINKKALFFSV